MGPTIIITIITNVSPKSNWTQAQQDGCRIRSSGGALLGIRRHFWPNSAAQRRRQLRGTSRRLRSTQSTMSSQPWTSSSGKLLGKSVGRETFNLDTKWNDSTFGTCQVIIKSNYYYQHRRAVLIAEVLIAEVHSEISIPSNPVQLFNI